MRKGWIGLWLLVGNAMGLWAADSMNVYLARRETWIAGGSVIRAASLDNTVYLALQLTSRHGLWVVDVSNPAVPRRVNTLTFDTLGTVEDVKVHNGYGYVLVSGLGLVVLDLTDPENPVPLTTVNIPACFQGLVAVSDSLLATVTCDALYLFDISTPFQPVPLGSGGSFDEPKEALFYDVDHLLVADRQGLHIIDLSDPAQPQEVAVVRPGQMIYDVTVYGSYAYATTSVILSVDLSDPSQPAVVDTLAPMYPLGSFYRLFATSAGLYALSGGPYAPEFLVRLSLSDPAHPSLQETLRVSAVPEKADLIVSGPWVYLTSGGLYALRIIRDSAGILMPVGICGGLYTSQSEKIAIHDTLVAITDGPGLWFLSIADSVTTRNIGTNGQVGPTAAVAWGTLPPYLFATSGGWNSTLYIFHPESLFGPPIGQIPLNDHITHLLPLGRYLYAFGTQGLQIVDVSDPHNPDIVQSISGLGAEDIACQDNLLFVAHGISLEVWDISDTTSPVLLTTYPYPALSVATGDSLVFVGLEDSVYILDMRNPLSPQKLSTFPLYWEHGARGLTFVAPYLFFHADGPPYMTLYVLDVSNPQEPLLAGFYRFRNPAGAADLAVGGETWVLATAQYNFEYFGFRRPRADLWVLGDTASVDYEVRLPIVLAHPQDSVAALHIQFKASYMLLDSVQWSLSPGFTMTVNSTGSTIEITIQSVTDALPPATDTLGTLFLHFYDLVEPGDSLTIYSRWPCEAWDLQGEAVPLIFHTGWVAAAPDPPQVLWPPDGSYLGSDSVVVIWNASNGAVAYTLELALDPDFENLVDSLNTPDTTMLLVNLAESRYYLRIQAVSAEGYRGDFSTPITFEVDTTGPITPVLEEPVGGTWRNVTPVTFLWSPVSFVSRVPTVLAAPVRYVIQVLQESTVVITDTVDTNTATLDLGEGRYLWRVQAFDMAGHTSAWAGPDSFGLDLTPPSVDSLTHWTDTTGFFGPWPVHAWVHDSLSGIAEVWLLYQADTLPWDSVMMFPGDGFWEGEIPELPGVALVGYFVRAVDIAGNSSTSDTLTFAIVSVQENSPTVTSLRLLGLWSTSGVLSFRFALPEPISVGVHLYDVTGRRVRTWQRHLEPGIRIWRIEPHLPAGLYLIRIETGRQVWFRKVFLSRGA